MAWRLGDDEESSILGAAIKYLVWNRRIDFDSLLRLKRELLTRDFNRQLSFKHEEKLTRPFVIVPNFARARRHTLQNHAELGRPDQVPSVTGVILGSPGRVRGVGGTYRAWASQRPTPVAGL